jgi:hypothetical protein
VRNHPLNAVDPSGLDDWWRTPSPGSYDDFGNWDWGFPGSGCVGCGSIGPCGATARAPGGGQGFSYADQMPMRSGQDCNDGGGCFTPVVVLPTVTITGSGQDRSMTSAMMWLTMAPGLNPWVLNTPWQVPTLTLPSASTGLMVLQRLSLPLALLAMPGNVGQDNGTGPRPGELGWMESRAGEAGGSDEGALDADGTNSASGGAPPPDDDSGESLTQGQRRAVNKIDRIIKNFKDSDIDGAIKDMQGNPVPKPGGGHWNHLQEVQDVMRGLSNHAETLNGVNNLEAIAARSNALNLLNRINGAFRAAGF